MNSEGTLNHKQHLNLSRSAFDIIESDQQAFQADSISGFLNQVFVAYYELAEASVTRCLNRRRDQLTAELSGTEAERERVLELLLEQEQNRLLDQIRSNAKGCGFQFYLNKENLDILLREFPEESRWYQGHPMRYYKAVVEEYAKKDRIRREEIFFRSRMEELQACISRQLVACIETEHRRFEVRPYQIVIDHESMNHYFVGLSRPVDGQDQEERIASFRISRIEKLRARPKSYRSGRITAREKEQIEEKIGSDCVQFLVGEPEKVEVFLTEKGLELFRKQSHLRPTPLSEEPREGGAVLSFRCTAHQVCRYFFPFGPEVEVLRPESIRKHFEEQYLAAARLYRQD